MNKPSLFLFLLLVVLCGCAAKPHNDCKPVLMPYIEHDFKAEPQELSGAYVQKGEEVIEFHGVKVALPQGWRYEKISSDRAIKFINDKDRVFLLLFENNRYMRDDDFEGFHMVGCKNFSTKKPGKNRTKKEFYTDLYLFTEDQLDGDPTFWQYYILWTKTEFLSGAVELIHYTGKNLEAFQRNFDYRAGGANTGIAMKSEIFPNKIAPDYFIIVTYINDDVFFAGFLEMLNAMNPHE